MALPFMDPRMNGAVLTPEEPANVPFLVDSPLQTKSSASRPEDAVGKEQTPSEQGKQQTPKAKKSQSGNAGNSSSFRFVVVDHPDRLKDKQEMRENRMHVMHDFLDKERRRPGSKDPRLNSSGRPPRGRKKLYDDNQTSIANGSASRQDLSRLTPAESVQSNASSQSDQESRRNSTKRPAPGAKSANGTSLEPAAIARRIQDSIHNEHRLVTGMGGRFENTEYMKAALHDIPTKLGCDLEPFGTWPALSDASINLSELKWNCSQRFGSAAISVHWIPTMLKARHAFLSTLCISSAHDAIMGRALRPTAAQTGYESMQRWQIKNDVTSMVVESINDPEMRNADETIVAILHLLNSDVMGCDDKEMRVHQSGLQTMVEQRGGLERLGLGGQLAQVMTGTMYLIAALRETIPHRDFVKYASKSDTKIPFGSQSLPESPIYCRAAGFQTIFRSISVGSPIHRLLDALRAITNQFYVQCSLKVSSSSTSQRSGDHTQSSNQSVHSLRKQVFAFQPAQDMDFGDMNERYMYECIRLTGRMYAYALDNKISLSKAAADLSSQPRYFFASHKEYDRTVMERPTPISIKVKHALMRTDMSFCWDHMAGVLLWVVLIAGSGANPGPFATEERVGEDEDARKFLTAIAVRCFVVLSFQFGTPILETLKRLVAIEGALAGYDQPFPISEVVETVPETTQRTYGPMEPPEKQKGFADFAQDFEF